MKLTKIPVIIRGEYLFQTLLGLVARDIDDDAVSTNANALVIPQSCNRLYKSLLMSVCIGCHYVGRGRDESNALYVRAIHFVFLCIPSVIYVLALSLLYCVQCWGILGPDNDK